jgi:hypothetical protein
MLQSPSGSCEVEFISDLADLSAPRLEFFSVELWVHIHTPGENQALKPAEKLLQLRRRLRRYHDGYAACRRNRLNIGTLDKKLVRVRAIVLSH